MSLSSEDVLRLSVLLANNVEAIRIDEQAMTVYGLSGDNEARVHLNPNCRPEQYLRRVREMLSSHTLGSPGGYPVFLQRWTRMGQAKDAQLEKLLLLGEPEAVVAVAGAPGLTDAIARRAWWAMPTPDAARRMLRAPAVVQGEMGKVLAEFLVEHLPFETEPINVVTTVRLVLQPRLISEEQRARIWAKGSHRNAYHLGFLEATPDDLPQKSPPRSDRKTHAPALRALAQRGNSIAALLDRTLDSVGQSFLAVSESLLEQPVNQDTVSILLNVIGKYFAAARVGNPPRRDVEAVLAHSHAQSTQAEPAVREITTDVPELAPEIQALLTLGHASEEMILPIVAKTTASGTLLKRKLAPVTEPLLARYATLRGASRVDKT